MQFTNMDDKVPDVAVIALLILQKIGCVIADSANPGEGSTLGLPISAVKVSSRVKFSKLFMILKEQVLQKTAYEAGLSGSNAFLQLLYLQPTATTLLPTHKSFIHSRPYFLCKIFNFTSKVWKPPKSKNILS